MKLKTVFVSLWCLGGSALLLGLAPQRGQRGQQGETPAVQEKLPREVTSTDIPGVIAAGAKWQQIWAGIDNADGIIPLPDGSVVFAQEQPSIGRRIDLNDMDSAYIKDTHGGGSFSMDKQGRIYAVQRTCTDPGRGNLPCNEPPKVAIVYPDRERKVIADNIDGKPLPRGGDVAVHTTSGAVYFTGGGAYYVKPGGKVVNLNVEGANGIIFSRDDKTLYATSGPVILAFDVSADGTPSNRREFAKFVSGNGDGMAIDSEGRLYVACMAAHIQVFGPDGKYLGTIPTPRNPNSITFGGRDKKTLYMIGGGMLHPSGQELTFANNMRNVARTIYKIPMLAQGYRGRPK